jgi:iron complex outermembrane receptor protein
MISIFEDKGVFMLIPGKGHTKTGLLARAAMPLVVVASFATPAVAQEAPPKEAQVDEIVVTAQKREQSAQDVGITLNAYSGEQLIKAGVVSAPDIARLTPGVGISGSFAGQNVTYSIRGVTQQDFQAHAEGPVAVYIDEGYLAANNAAGIGLFDIERVEILKGPQGTLFGRNATGGLVSITTKKPTKSLSADASLSYGSYNNLRAEAAIGGPLSDNMQLRIAGLYDRNDGWVDNLSPTGGDLGGKETFAARAHLAVQPSSNVDLLFTGYFSDVRQSWGPYFALSTRSTASNGIPNAIIVQQPTLFGEPASNGQDLEVAANSAQSKGAFNKVAGGTFRASFDLGGTDLTAITDYKVLKYKLLLDDDATEALFLNTTTTARVENFTQELRLYHDFHGARLTAGLYYLNIDASQVDLQRLFGLGGVQVESPFRLKTNSYSAFAQGEVDVTSGVTLIGGFRATREEKSFKYNAFVQNTDGTPIVDGRSYSGSSGQWLYSWKAQAEFRPVDRVLLYAGYSRGTKAGSFNAPFAGGATPADPDVPYKAEKLDSFEIGAKTTLAEHVTLNASVFHYIYKDYQAFKFVNFSTVVANNPARETGAEIELNVRPIAGLELMGSVSYVDAKVRNVAVANSLAATVLDRKPPFTSKWQAVASARYEVPLASGTLALQGDVQYRSNFFFSLTNFDATRVPGYALLNARIAWTTSDDQWEFAVFGKNLGDERYRTVGFEASDFGGFTQVGYGEPRWLGASIRYKLR